MLSGRSELVIEAARSGPADFILEPWTPAILAAPQTSRVVGARDSGQAEPVDRSVAQPDHRARLGITAAIARDPDGVSRWRYLATRRRCLTLDIPKDWVPSVSLWKAARSLSSECGRVEQNRWEIESESGRIDVHLYEPGPGTSLVEANTWVSGSTPDRPPRRRPNAREVWSTGRRNGVSSLILVIRNHCESSSIRAWS